MAGRKAVPVEVCLKWDELKRTKPAGAESFTLASVFCKMHTQPVITL